MSNIGKKGYLDVLEKQTQHAPLDEAIKKHITDITE